MGVMGKMTAERRASVHTTAAELLLAASGLTLVVAIGLAVALGFSVSIAQAVIWSLIFIASINVALVVTFLWTLPGDHSAAPEQERSSPTG